MFSFSLPSTLLPSYSLVSPLEAIKVYSFTPPGGGNSGRSHVTCGGGGRQRAILDFDPVEETVIAPPQRIPLAQYVRLESPMTHAELEKPEDYVPKLKKTTGNNFTTHDLIT